jgi:hypothetical protein
MDNEFEALIAKGKKTPQEVESMIQLANEVQYAVLHRKLQPGTLPLFTGINDSSLNFSLISYENLLSSHCLSVAWGCKSA